MKKLIESMDRIEGYGMSEMGAMPPMSAPTNPGTPVSMNVSLNASGKEHVDDLINMMKNAGMGAAQPVAAKMLSPRMDMERLSAMMDEPEMDMGPEMEELEDEMGEEAACPTCDMAPCDCDHTEESADDGGFGDATTEPDPQYGDMSDAIPNGNDLNRKKGTYAAVAGGDNPMKYKIEVESIKKALYAALTEKKSDKISKEGNAFGKAVRDAKSNGDKTVKVGGKTVPVKEGELPAALKAYQDKKSKGKAPAKGASKSGKMPMDAGKDGKKGTKDDKPAFLKKEEMATEGMAEGRNTNNPVDDMVEDYLDWLDARHMLTKRREEEKAQIMSDLKSGYLHPNDIDYAMSSGQGMPEGRGKVMAGRGRGKLMAGRGRGKLMAGRGRGK